MRKYVLTSPGFKGELIFGYNSEQVLVHFENNAELEAPHLDYLKRNFPFVADELPKVVRKGKLTEITDLSFTKFWADYSYKVGNKARAEKLWNKLQESERIAVFEALPRYNYYLKTHPSIEKTYAETFLYQRRWENEYK